MPGKKELKISLIIIIIVLCIPLTLRLAYKYRTGLNIEKRIIQLKDALLSGDRIAVKINLLAGVNGKDLRVVFYIPCNDQKTKQDIIDNMVRIKHEMIMSMDNAQNKISIEKRDFRRIKSNCLTKLNRYAPVDVNKVYVEFFAHN